MQAADVEFVRAIRFCENLRRIIAAKPRGFQAEAARMAQISTVHLSRLLTEPGQNPRIGTMEALAAAIEVPLETLLSANPTDIDLGIFRESGK